MPLKSNIDNDFYRILEKARKYCAFQERCHQELREKLYSWLLPEKSVEQIISELISEGFLNEERFAKAFSRGKFRIKRWGKNKITNELKRRNISEYSIRKGLKEIETILNDIKVTYGSGLKFKIPFIDSVKKYSNMLLTYDTTPRQVITADKKKLIFDNNAQWKISNPALFEVTMARVELAQTGLDDIL